MARRSHAMPFGAQAHDGGVRFRLWAPGAERVDLLLEDAARGSSRLSLERADGGWWFRDTDAAASGSRYRFCVDGGLAVPDPASRYQPEDVHGPSEVIDPRAFDWNDDGWGGRSWEEAVVYELHVGAFTREGDFDGVRGRLDHLARLGVTAIELMPLADFPGRRNWGYDGVLPFAPDATYGRPEALKRLVQEAHARGLMVLLDVVYNHFGPEGNYLHVYARPFFNPRRKTPWGDALNFDGDQRHVVRDFFVHNALYWIEEYHLDGLRIDAVHAIRDESRPSFLDELARRVQQGPGAVRPVHLVLENHDNEADRLERAGNGSPRAFTAQWNDDVHHALHCLLTGEAGGYYVDYSNAPARHLARGLAEGFTFQGQRSEYGGHPRGQPSGHLPPQAFVNFLQNHDQIGNRAFGERLAALADEEALAAATAVLLLAPSPPLLFMGEELGSRNPFPFFCDFGPDLATAVTEGRRREFERFPEFRDPATRALIPDPNARETFELAVLDWDEEHAERGRRSLARYRELLALRREEIVPRLAGCAGGCGRHRLLDERSARVDWRLGGGSTLTLLAHLGAGEGPIVEQPPAGRLLYAAGRAPAQDEGALRLGAWTVLWFLDTP